jgi:hypothetical protein
VGGSVVDEFFLQLIAEEMKICSYIHVGKEIYIHQMFPKDWTFTNCLYRKIYLICHPQDWRGTGLLNICLSHRLGLV